MLDSERVGRRARAAASVLLGCAVVCATGHDAAAQCDVNELTKLTASDAAAGDRFGHGVAHAGEWSLVGAPDKTNANGAGAGSAYLFRHDDGGTPGEPSDDTWTEHAILLASSGGPGDEYGSAVAIDGNRMVVGAQRELEAGRRYGAAYVYRRDDGGAWLEEARIVASDKSADDLFGAAVAIEGDWIAVGAANGDTGTADTGSVYMFRRGDNGTPFDPTDDVWIEHEKNGPAALAAGDGYGAAVSLVNDRLMVGAPGHGTTGGAFLFWHRTNGTFPDLTDDGWDDQDEILPSDGASGDLYGAAVALADDHAIVGASAHTGSKPASGAGYVQTWNDNGTAGTLDDDFWTETQELSGSDTAAGDALGGGVAMSGTDLVTGAPADDDLGDASGAAFLFRGAAGTWSEEAKLVASDGAADSAFGGAIAMNAEHIVIGAAGADADAGAAYVFDATVITDCNDNRLCDLFEIDAGMTNDTNANGIPDECEVPPCPGDLDGSGGVGFTDLNELLGDWGACPGCPADIDGNGTVGFGDLNILLGGWGPCS